MSARVTELLTRLRGMRNEVNIAGQRRFGIRPTTEQLGISMTSLRSIGKSYKGDHALALELWTTEVHEARLLAAIIDDHKQVTKEQIGLWAQGLDTWALTDATAFLFDRTPFAFDVAFELSSHRAEFEKRMGFSMMAGMAVHRKELADDVFLRMLPVIRRESCDDRNFVRKAVNWALRQIGKRNSRLRRAAMIEAKHILSLETPSAVWIANDAIRELQGKKTA